MGLGVGGQSAGAHSTYSGTVTDLARPGRSSHRECVQRPWPYGDSSFHGVSDFQVRAGRL